MLGSARGCRDRVDESVPQREAEVHGVGRIERDPVAVADLDLEEIVTLALRYNALRIEHHQLPITRSIFMRGKAPYKFMAPRKMSLGSAPTPPWCESEAFTGDDRRAFRPEGPCAQSRPRGADAVTVWPRPYPSPGQFISG